jgi:hypothetical protein
MDHNDRQAIDDLFGKIAEAEHQSGPRDAQAEAYIRDKIAAQPAAPYLMAQTIVIQEQALEAAQAEIEALEYELSRRQSSGGGFLASLFGSREPAPRPMPRPEPTRAAYQPQPAAPEPAQSPWGRTGTGFGQPQPQSSGFLAGAAQTAMGVAGGVLLGNAVAGMFGADKAHAGEKDDKEDDNQDDDGGDDGGDFDLFEL